MTQVSKYPLNKEVKERIFEIFWESILGLKNKKETQEFFDDFFTPTEKVMLAKRLAIGSMLLKGYDYRTIQETLKVSSATIKEANLWIKHGGEGCKKILTKIIKKQRQAEFWDNLEEYLSQMFPPRYGSDWKRERKEEWKRRIERRQKRALI